jgi:carbon-monoxide dehydrogenase catalytic subunit
LVVKSPLVVGATEMVKEGGLGDDISELPAVGSAPLWMSEKAVAIGQYFVTSGAHVIFQDLPVTGAKQFSEFILGGLKEEYGASWGVEGDPIKHARAMIAAIDEKREALGINKKQERVLMDMAMRRELEGQALPGAGCGQGGH